MLPKPTINSMQSPSKFQLHFFTELGKKKRTPSRKSNIGDVPVLDLKTMESLKGRYFKKTGLSENDLNSSTDKTILKHQIDIRNVFKVLCDQGHAINCIEISSHPCQNSYHKTTNDNNMFWWVSGGKLYTNGETKNLLATVLVKVFFCNEKTPQPQ